MNFFQSPPVSRYDLNFTLFGIPVRVHPLFWLMTILFGASTSNLIHLLIWVVVVFISILVHELGHAFAMRYYGRESSIVLYLGGGLTVRGSMRWGNRWAAQNLGGTQEIMISLAGPLAGFLLAAFVMLCVAVLGGIVTVRAMFGVIPLPAAYLPRGGLIVNLLIGTIIWVNVFWGLINLMPVFPLDGGNISRHIFLKIDPWNGLRKSLWLSVGAGAVVACLGLFLFNSIYIALLFGILAFQSYQMVQGRSVGLF